MAAQTKCYIWFILCLFTLLIGIGISKPRHGGSESSDGEVDGISPHALASYSAGGHYAMLTFEGGPHHTNTAAILNILKSKSAKATFFIQGSLAIDHPDLIRRMIVEGHEVGLSGWTDQPFTEQSLEAVTAQITKNRLAIPYPYNQTAVITVRAKRGKAGVVHVRPPNGVTTDAINQHIAVKLGLQVVLWSVDARDMDDTVLSRPQAVVENVLAQLKPGGIIRCRDASPGVSAYLPQLVDALHGKYFELLTVAEMRRFPDDKPH